MIRFIKGKRKRLDSSAARPARPLPHSSKRQGRGPIHGRSASRTSRRSGKTGGRSSGVFVWPIYFGTVGGSRIFRINRSYSSLVGRSRLRAIRRRVAMTGSPVFRFMASFWYDSQYNPTPRFCQFGRSLKLIPY